MHFFEKNGVGIKHGKNIFVDAFGLKNSSVLVSHAHSDHCRVTSSNTYFMNPQTRVLSGHEKSSNIVEKNFGKKFSVNGFDVSMHSSGHIIGSAQFHVCNSLEATVTTDFKLQESLLLKPAEILPCDILAIETTFGLKEFSFPPREQVYADMEKWAKEKISQNSFVVLCGYATGKAQELTKFCNEFLGIVPLVHKKIFEKNRLAEKAGFSLGGYIELDHNLRDSSVLILPPNLANDLLLEALSMQLGKKVECAVATGWKRFSRYKTFPLSDHADFEGLLQYVRQAEPKMVFTYHGFAKEFAQTVLRELKIPAKPLYDASQKTLAECV